MKRRQRLELLFVRLVRNTVKKVIASNLSADEKAERLMSLARRQASRGLAYERRFWQGILDQSPSCGVFAEFAQLRRRASAFFEASARQVRYESGKTPRPEEHPFMDYSA